MMPDWMVQGLTIAISGFDKQVAFDFFFYLVLVAFGIGSFLFFGRHRRFVEPIKRLTRQLEQIQGLSPKETRLDAAAQAFEQAPPKLKTLWAEYREHLKENSQTDAYVNLISPRAWFSLESLPGRGYEHWCATGSGVFLTVGLLFTFIGLSAALLKVSGINGADSAAMKAAITGILDVSSAKFITSIAGIGAYIAFSLLTRFFYDRQHTVAVALADAIQHLSIPLTPELLLYEQNDNGRKQLLRLERLTDDLAVAIDTKLKERVADLAGAVGTQLGTLSDGLAGRLDQIREALPSATAQPIVEAIGGLGTGIAQANQQAMQEMLAIFRTQMQQTGRSEMNAVVERLGTVAEELGKVQGGMRGAGAAFGADIQAAAEKLGLAAEQMRQSANSQSSELGQQLAQFSASLGSITATLGETPEQINRALNETLSKLTTAIDALVVKLELSSQAVGSAGKHVAATGAGFQQQIGDSTGALAQVVLQLTTTFQLFTDRLNTVEAKLQSLPNAIALQVAHLERTGSAFATAGHTVQGASQTLQQATLPLNATATALRESTQELRQTFTQQITHLNHAGTALQGAGESVSKATETMRQTTTPFADTALLLRESAQALQGAVQQLGQQTRQTGEAFLTVGGMVEEVTATLHQAATPIAETTAALRQAAERVQQSVHEGTQQQEALKGMVDMALQKLAAAATAAERAFQTHEQRFGTVDVALGRTIDRLKTGVEEITGTLNQAFGQYDKHITQAMSSLQQGVENLAEAIEDSRPVSQPHRRA